MTAPAVSYPPPVSPAAPRRPRGVFAAAYLLAGAAAFWLAAAIATLFALPQYDRYHSDLAQNPDAGSGVVLLLVLFAFGAIVASGLAVPLAFGDAGGRPAARVLTWILGGLAVCVAGVLLLSDPFTAAAWHHGLMIGTSVLTLVVTAAVIVLLGLRSSGDYFLGVREARRARLAYAARYRPAPQYPQAPPGWTVYHPPPGPPMPPPPFAPRPQRPPRPPSGPPPTENDWGRPG